MLPVSPAAAGPTSKAQFFSKQVALAAGSFQIREGERSVGQMRRGLKVAIMLEGQQSLALDDRPAVMIEGPALLVAANSGEHRQRRTVIADAAVRCVLIQFDLDFVEREFAVPVERLLALAGGADAGLWVRPADARLRALGLQMAECAVAEPLRRLYLAGKALELAALALDEIVGKPEKRPSRLPTRTRDQVRAVRDRLVGSMQDPPSLAELARASGLNPTKLTSAFRIEFGTSVFGYLQEHRLQQAHLLIASGAATIAEAAFRVGYTPAHFSSLFRKRFGVPPSGLR